MRNLLRPYSATSVVKLAFDVTQSVRNDSMIEQLKTWPWLTFLIVKLVLEDQMIPLNAGQQCPLHVFDQCRQLLWDVPRRDDHLGSGGDDSRGNVYLMLRSMVQTQLLFQKNLSWDFIRWPALIARLEPEHPTRVQFENRLGMSPDDFVVLCFSAYATVINGNTIIGPGFFEPFEQGFGVRVARFLGEFSRDLPGLRRELRMALRARIASGKPPRNRQELVEFPWIANYPLLRLPGERYAVWHPIVFARGMETAVHKRLSELKGKYADSFSKVFEGYVLELIADAGLDYLNEQAYKTALGAGKHAVEAIITCSGANVFIESKMTVFSEDLTLSDRAPVVWQNMKRVLEAMNQGWMVSSMLRSGATPAWECTHAVKDYLIIVTSQQINCASAEHFTRMFNRDVFDSARLQAAHKKTPTAEQPEKAAFDERRNCVDR
ncbi:MAG: hypothetical protein IPG66_18680 [Hydrogenophilales bacterium]|nr:hypothetical protein [Hydrogenophilales bacterium]